MTIEERIKKVRKEKHLTQQELAEKIGSVQNTITGYETGRRAPSSAVISLICRTFHVNEAWLRTGEGEPYLPETEKILLNDASLDDADRALLNSYIEAPPDLRKQIRELLCLMADRMKDTAPAKEPHALTEDEWAMVQRHRTAKDGNSTEDGLLDTGA